MKKNYSRLARKEYKESLRKTFIFGSLTLILVLVVLFLGIPLLIKVAVLLGNLKNAYTPVETADQIPITAPRFKPTFEATSSSQISLEGYSLPEVVIDIYQNNQQKASTSADNEGYFSFPNLTLEPGQNEFYAKSTDKDNRKSPSSEKLLIDFDNTPPNITINEPAENSSIFTADGKVQIKGELSEEANFFINDRLVILDANNKFIFPVTLTDGVNIFRSVATDKAGNATQKEFSLTRE